MAFFTISWLNLVNTVNAALPGPFYHLIVHKNLLLKYNGSYQSEYNVKHIYIDIFPGVPIIGACP